MEKLDNPEELYVENIPCTWQPTPQKRRRFTPEACYIANIFTVKFDFWRYEHLISYLKIILMFQTLDFRKMEITFEMDPVTENKY